MTHGIDLELFRVSRQAITKASARTTPKVFMPKNVPFRIHADPSVTITNIWMALYEGRWYLLHTELAESGLYVPGLKMYKADLYLGVLTDGNAFWMPVTHPTYPENAEWRRSLLAIIPDARKQWMIVETDHDKRQYVGWKSSLKAVGVPWPKESPDSLLERAFRDRIMDEHHPCMDFAELRETVTVVEE